MILLCIVESVILLMFSFLVNNMILVYFVGSMRLLCIAEIVIFIAANHLLYLAGLTNFDLLGNFGQLEWLGNFYIVLSYNLVFAVAATLCLVTKFTSSMRAELLHRLEQVVGRHPSTHALSKEE